MDKLKLIMERFQRSNLPISHDRVREILNGERNLRHGVPVDVERSGGKTAPNGEVYHVKIKASTASVARDAGIIPLGAWQDGGLRNFDKNPVILPFHDYGQLPIAKSVYHEIDHMRGALVEYWNFHGETELSRQMQTLYEKGYMRAASVGFLVKEYEFVDIDKEKELQKELSTTDPIFWIAQRAELLETSAVPVPADPGAVAIDHAIRNGLAHGDSVDSVERIWVAVRSGKPIETRSETVDPVTNEQPGVKPVETVAPAGAPEANKEAAAEPTLADVMKAIGEFSARIAKLEEKSAAAPAPAAPAPAEAERSSKSGVEVSIQKKDGETDEQAVARYVDEAMKRILGAPVSSK